MTSTHDRWKTTSPDETLEDPPEPVYFYWCSKCKDEDEAPMDATEDEEHECYRCGNLMKLREV